MTKQQRITAEEKMIPWEIQVSMAVNHLMTLLEQQPEESQMPEARILPLDRALTTFFRAGVHASEV